MSYPPRYGHPQGYPQPPVHPQQQWRQRPAYPPPGYGAPQQAYPPPPPPRRKKPNKVVYFVSLFLCLGLGGVAAYAAFSASEPKVGDCLAGTEKRFFGGLEIVDCEGGKAKYRVVAHVDNARGACRNYEGDGEEIIDAGRKRRVVYWSICVTPV